MLWNRFTHNNNLSVFGHLIPSGWNNGAFSLKRCTGVKQFSLAWRIYGVTYTRFWFWWRDKRVFLIKTHTYVLGIVSNYIEVCPARIGSTIINFF